MKVVEEQKGSLEVLGEVLGRPTSTRNVVMAFFRHFSLKTTIESYFVSQ